MGAHVILLSNIAPTCFIDSILKASTNPSSEAHQSEWPRHEEWTPLCFPAKVVPAHQEAEDWVSFLRHCRRSCLVALRSNRVCWGCSLRVILSGPGKLVVRRCRKHRNVGRGVTGPKCQIRVFEFVAAVCIHMPFIRALGHDEKPSALAI